MAAAQWSKYILHIYTFGCESMLRPNCTHIPSLKTTLNDVWADRSKSLHESFLGHHFDYTACSGTGGMLD
jgi:hypothetical protein